MGGAPDAVPCGCTESFQAEDVGKEATQMAMFFTLKQVVMYLDNRDANMSCLPEVVKCLTEEDGLAAVSATIQSLVHEMGPGASDLARAWAAVQDARDARKKEVT